jgi:hypothetical protein
MWRIFSRSKPAPLIGKASAGFPGGEGGLPEGPLTGLRNRRFLDEVIAEEVETSSSRRR